MPDGEKLAEAAFVDAVAGNLRRGRVLVLLVGDGIRGEADALLDGLRVHLRFGFTLAIVELALFRMPGSDRRILVRPSTIAKTVITQRTIIETTVNGTIVSAREEKLAAPRSISSDSFWDGLERKVPGAGARKALEHLIQKAESFGVYPEFLKSMILRWNRPDGRAVNLGYIVGNIASPSIWTDLAAAAQVPRELAHAYVSDLAKAWDCDVHTLPTSGNWTLFEKDEPLRLVSVLDQLDSWLGPIQRFISALNKRDGET